MSEPFDLHVPSAASRELPTRDATTRELLSELAEGRGPSPSIPLTVEPGVAQHAPLASAVSALLGLLRPHDAEALLLSLAEQTRTLRLVREAHERGAIALPDELAGRVASTVERLPSFLLPPLTPGH